MKEFWTELGNLQERHTLPWTFLGDFNAIIKAHEHNGRLVPAIGPIRDFQEWTDAYQLLHVPNKGAFLLGQIRVIFLYFFERKLGCVIVNHDWMSICTSNSVCTLSKLPSDHHPIMLEFSISTINVISQFRFLKAWTLHNDCNSLVKSCWKQKLWECLLVVLGKKLQMLKKELKGWN